MATETRAIPLAELEAASGKGAGTPLCPGCAVGRLWPYRVQIDYGAMATELVGWVALCVGDEAYLNRWAELSDAERTPRVQFTHPPCGFSMPIAPIPCR